MGKVFLFLLSLVLLFLLLFFKGGLLIMALELGILFHSQKQKICF